MQSKDCCVKNFLKACQVGHTQRVEKELNRSVDIDCTDEDKRTGLMLASMNGKKDTCSFLLSCNASTRKQDKYAWNARMYAIHHKHNDIADAIKEIEDNER
jgi:ankyrin repeat protein